MAGKEERKQKIAEEQARRAAQAANGGNGKSNGTEGKQPETSEENLAEEGLETVEQIQKVAVEIIREGTSEEEKKILEKLTTSPGLLDQVKAFLTGKKETKTEAAPAEPEKMTETVQSEATQPELSTETPTPATTPTEPKKEDGDEFLLHLEERIVALEKGHKENIAQADKAISEAVAELKAEFAKAKSTAAKVVNETTDEAMRRSFLDFEKAFRTIWEPRFVEVLGKAQEARIDAAKAEAAMSDVTNYLPLLRQMATVKEDLAKMQALRDEITAARDAIMAALGKPTQQETKSTGLFG